MLETSLDCNQLAKYIAGQMQAFFPDGSSVTPPSLNTAIGAALNRYEVCCQGITRKYFSTGKHTLYNHLNSDQHAMFLYLLSRELYLNEEQILATKAYYLNKALHSIDVMYTVELPDKFMFSHCVGTVLGKAKYGNYFRVGQNCTVGNDNGNYPIFGEGVALYKGSLVAGACNIGSNVHVSAHSFVRNTDIPDNIIAIGSSPDLKLKKSSTTVKECFFYPA